MKERTLCRSAPKFNDVCQCIYEWSDEELEDLSDDDFEDLPCATCGGRLVDLPEPVSMAERRGRLLMRPDTEDVPAHDDTVRKCVRPTDN